MEDFIVLDYERALQIVRQMRSVVEEIQSFYKVLEASGTAYAGSWSGDSRAAFNKRIQEFPVRCEELKKRADRVFSEQENYFRREKARQEEYA